MKKVNAGPVETEVGLAPGLGVVTQEALEL